METIDIDFLISGTRITIPFTAICSITNQKFMGDIIIEYRPSKKIIEYVDTETVIKNITTKNKLTVEELAYKIFKIITENIHPQYLKVVIDVKKSKAHQPVQVWIEKSFK